jgi:hypothetical protein
MKRYNSIGIKQTVRLEWMEKTSNLLLSGLSKDEIREELRIYLINKMGNGSTGERSKEASRFSVNILMNTWINPDKNLEGFRDAGIDLLKNLPQDDRVAVHWGMICSTYPFWYNVAKQIGILLNLQETVSAQQITQRVIENYGDRPTVSRNARFVIRSIYYWNMLREKELRGNYSRGIVRQINSVPLIAWLAEAQLHSIPEGRLSLSVIQKNPVFFAFDIPYFQGNVSQFSNKKIEIIKNGYSDDILILRK